MSEIKNSGLDQYGAEPFEQQQFRTAGIEGVKGLMECWCLVYAGVRYTSPDDHLLVDAIEDELYICEFQSVTKAVYTLTFWL